MNQFVRYILLFILFVLSLPIFSQIDEMSLSVRPATIFGTNQFFRGVTTDNQLPIDRANLYVFRMANRLADDNTWHKAYRYPTVGFGVEYAHIFNNTEIGRPWSAYLFVESGIVDKNRFRLSWTADLGLSYGWIPYNTQENKNNVALGSRLNYHAGFGLRSEYLITNRVGILVAAMLNHHSNGAVTKPNLGINMIAVEVGLKVLLRDREFREEWTKPTRDWQPYNSISLFAGTRNLEIDSTYKAFYGVSVRRMWPVSAKFHLGLGSELMYDTGNKGSSTPNVFGSFFLSGSITFDNLSCQMDIGRYHTEARRDFITRSPYFQRLTTKYRVTKRIFLGVSVRAFEVRKADLLEWHVGYQI